jgi:hypothetical protein
MLADASAGVLRETGRFLPRAAKFFAAKTLRARGLKRYAKSRAKIFSFFH